MVNAKVRSVQLMKCLDTAFLFDALRVHLAQELQQVKIRPAPIHRPMGRQLKKAGEFMGQDSLLPVVFEEVPHKDNTGTGVEQADDRPCGASGFAPLSTLRVWLLSGSRGIKNHYFFYFTKFAPARKRGGVGPRQLLFMATVSARPEVAGQKISIRSWLGFPPSPLISILRFISRFFARKIELNSHLQGKT